MSMSLARPLESLFATARATSAVTAGSAAGGRLA